MTIENSKKLIASFTKAAQAGDVGQAGAKLSKLEDYMLAAKVPAEVLDFVYDSAMTALTKGDTFDAVEHFTYGAFLIAR